MHLHKSKLIKFKHPKYNNKHNLNNKHNKNKVPIVNQYISIYLDDANSHVIYILLILAINRRYKQNKLDIHIHIKIVKENNTIAESNKNNIQKDNI